MAQPLNHNEEQDFLLYPFSHRKDPYLRPMDTAEQLKNLLWHEFELSRAVFGWLPAASDFELKAKLGRFGYVHMMHVTYLQQRIKELPLGLNESAGTPASIQTKMNRIFLASSESCFLLSYQFVLERIYADYDLLLTKLDVITDAPTIDQLQKIGLARSELNSYVKSQVDSALGHIKNHDEVQAWRQYITEIWTKEDSLWSEHPINDPLGPVPSHSKMDARFQEVSRGDAHNIYSSSEYSPLSDSVRQMVFINSTEIIAAESLCYLYYSLQGMPLSFYADLARHLWDEVRHSQMGVRRLLQMGYTLDQFRYFPHMIVGPETTMECFIESYFSLTNIAEACSFKSKRQAAEHLWKHNDPLSAIQSEFDIADERLHVDFGNKWGPMLYERIKKEPITSKDLAKRARSTYLKTKQYDDLEKHEMENNNAQFCGTVGVKLNFKNY
jgi:hypothetical protein